MVDDLAGEDPHVRVVAPARVPPDEVADSLEQLVAEIGTTRQVLNDPNFSLSSTTERK
jgi:hypothetical protein